MVKSVDKMNEQAENLKSDIKKANAESKGAIELTK